VQEMAKSKQREYTWYVEPLDDFTNECIARELPEEDALRKVMCSDGEERNLWRCKHSFITEVKNNHHAFRYKIFVREGNGVVRIWVKPKRKMHSLKSAGSLARI